MAVEIDVLQSWLEAIFNKLSLLNGWSSIFNLHRNKKIECAFAAFLQFFVSPQLIFHFVCSLSILGCFLSVDDSIVWWQPFGCWYLHSRNGKFGGLNLPSKKRNGFDLLWCCRHVVMHGFHSISQPLCRFSVQFSIVLPLNWDDNIELYMFVCITRQTGTCRETYRPARSLFLLAAGRDIDWHFDVKAFRQTTEWSWLNFPFRI